MREYCDSDDWARFGFLRSTGGTVLDHLYPFKVLAQKADKAAARAGQWDYLKGFRGFPPEAALLHANTLAPSDPPVLSADGAIRLDALFPPKRDPISSLRSMFRSSAVGL